MQFDLDTLDSYVKATYPDLRKCLNLLQPNSINNRLNPPGENDRGVKDWKLEAVAYFKAGKIKEGRQVVCQQATVEDMDDMFRWMYDNLELFGKEDETKDQALLIIKQGLVDHTLIADPEINLAACLVKLARLQ